MNNINLCQIWPSFSSGVHAISWWIHIKILAAAIHHIKILVYHGLIFLDKIIHGSHRQHLLFLNNQHLGNQGFTTNSKELTTTNWRSMVYNDRIMSCDGCTYPIYPSISQYYACCRCDYHLHAYCTVFQQMSQFYGKHNDMLSTKSSSSCLFNCRGCGFLRSGIPLSSYNGKFLLDIGCASLPYSIKHEAHKHILNHFGKKFGELCKACGQKFYYMHALCQPWSIW